VGLTEGIFAAGEHCVAYRTRKGVLFMFESTVLGRSCQIDARLDESAEGYRLFLSIPVTSFNSGNDRRDQHVAQLLGGTSADSLEFSSQWLSQEALAKVWNGGMHAVAGELVIRGKRRAVVFDVAVSAASGQHVLAARLRTSFSALGVVVPRVGPGGLIAAPGDRLELFAQLHADRVTDAALLNGLAQR